MSSPIDSLRDEGIQTDERPRVLSIADRETAEVIDALAADTRRAVLEALHEEPSTASEVAQRVGTSVQNAHYHLETLGETDLVEPVGSRYSEKNTEMTVYGPASDPIVLVGDEEPQSGIEQSLRDVIAGLGLLTVASLLVQWGVERVATGPGGGSSPLVSAAANGSNGLAPVAFDVLEPGVVFFLGCLGIVLAAHLVERR
ncbi:MAG: ArsR/SmtB family transcription factor [Halobaculum sp.]